MTDHPRRFFNCFWLTLVVVLVAVEAAPSRSKSKSKGPHLVTDQRQKGDYNIRLELKDFQIIALLGDNDGGDYEYAYDYADFTVKPSAGTSSTTTQHTTTTSTSPPPPPSSTSPPSTATSTPSQSSEKPFFNASSSKPEVFNSHQNGSPPSTNQKPSTTQKTSTTEETNSIENAVLINEYPFVVGDYEPSDAEHKPITEGSVVPMTPGKIKVQIMGEPSDTLVANNQPSGPVHIVPGEDLGESEGAPVDDVLKIRCASGFTRDKKGRCRRVRRPGSASQLPFGFSRFASNLASRLRLTPSQTSLDNSELP